MNDSTSHPGRNAEVYFNNVVPIRERQGNTVNQDIGKLQSENVDLKPVSQSATSKVNVKKRTRTMPNDPQAERDLTDAKIAAAEARTDTKFARLEGKMDVVLQELRTIAQASNEAKQEAKDTRLDAKTTRTTIVTTAIGAVLAIAALNYALASYGASQFYNGTVLRDLIAHVVHIRPASPSK